MLRKLSIGMILLWTIGASPAAQAEYLLVLDPVRLNAAVAVRGPGPDGRNVRPRAVAAACVRDGVLGPAAYAPGSNRCRAPQAVSGLTDAVAGLQVIGEAPGTTVFDYVAAGGIVAVETRRRLACRPGACARELFDDAGYPPELVGRPQPPPLPVPEIEQFVVTPDSLVVGEGAALTWTAVGVNRCRLVDEVSGAELRVDAVGSLPVEPARDTVWTLTCSAPGGIDAQQVSATVTPPPDAPDILVFEPLRDDIPTGASATLVWQTHQADECWLDDGESVGQVQRNGRRSIPIGADTRFVLACSNDVGFAHASTEVRVTQAAQAPTISFFQLSRSSVLRGDSIIASWEAPGATQCELSDNSDRQGWRLGAVAQFRLAPAANTVYALTCRNAYGVDRATRALSVTDNGETLEVLSLNLAHLQGSAFRGADGDLDLTQPGLVRITWTTRSAIACRLTSDAGQQISVAPNGSRILPIDRTTGLQFNCVSADAEAQAIREVRLRTDVIFASRFEV